MGKERLDLLLLKRGIAPSREKAKVIILAGEVYVSGEKVTKPDRKYPDDVQIELRGNPVPYVSFGGIKLEKAIKEFGLQISGKKAIDVGASTGGFTDCLLRFGASHVYAVDVGKNQLHHSLRSDPRVTVMEGVNARYLKYEMIGEFLEIATIDVSFISIKKIIPRVCEVIKPGGFILALVKPQFEVGRFEVGKNGIVRNHEAIRRVLREMKEFGENLNLLFKGELVAPKEKEKKNTEYFLLWEK